MSSQFWRFSVAALLSTLLVAALLAVLNNRMVKDQLIEQGAEKNMLLIQSLSNSMRGQLDQLLSQEPGEDSDRLDASREIERFQAALDERLRNLSIVNVKVYNKQGVTVFSSKPEQIGEQQHANPGVISALQGTPLSDLVQRDHLNRFEKVIEYQNLIHSYLPLRNEFNAINGVFEIYSEVTPLLYRIRESQQNILIAVFGVLGLFYAALVAAYARTDQAQQKEQQERENHLLEVEQEVMLRTRDLEESRSFLQTIMDGMSEAVMVIDKDFKVTSMNAAARAFLPADQDSSQPIYCYSATHRRETPCDAENHECSLREVLKTGQPCTLVHTHYTVDGEPRRVEVMASPLQNAEGEISGIIEVCHDITEREQLQAELIQARDAAERASHAKSEFVASMSHEIRTPMNAVIGMTDLLLKTRLTRKQQEYIQIVQSSGDMLLSVVDSILDFSRIEAGALTLDQHVINLSNLLDRVLEMMGYQAYSKGLELVGMLTAPDPSLSVLGDADRLRQILVNLTSNAIKFTERGQIVLRIELLSENDEQATLRFEVKDSGIGIDEAVQHKLFEPYTQIDAPSVRSNGGAGLGLTICKQLVEYMKGEIGVDSEPRHGSTFWFKLTLDKFVELANTPDHDAFAGKRVLVVDDHPDALHMLCHHFSSWGMQCECVSDASEALQTMQNRTADGKDSFDVAVIDVDMPGINGVSLARRIRGDTETADLPLVLLSSVAKPLNIGTVTSLRRAQCVHKPVLAGQLYDRLLEVTGIQEPNHTDVAPSPSLSIVKNQQDAQIMVAEDNLFSNQLLLDMLGSLGYEADTAVDGHEVLIAIANKAYDLILMDCQMPGMSGPEVTRQIRAAGTKYPKQPTIVALSADVSQQQRNACLEAGVDEFLHKPIRLEMLASGLQRWLPASATFSDDTTARVVSMVDVKGEAMGADIPEKDERLMKRHLKLFLEDAELRLHAMNTALEAADHDRLQREAHALKGSCMQLGIKSLYEDCATVHDAAGKGHTDVAAEGLQRLQTGLKSVRQAPQWGSGLLPAKPLMPD